MKLFKLTSFITLVFCLTCHATQVVFVFTNSSTGMPDTNDFKIVGYGNQRNSDGTFINPGLPLRVHNPTGHSTNWLIGPQYYQATNQFIGNSIWFRVPDASSNVVYAGDPSMALPGANAFVELTAKNFLPSTNIVFVTNSDGSVSIAATANANSVTNIIPTNAGPNVVVGPTLFLNTNYDAYGSAANAVTNTQSNVTLGGGFTGNFVATNIQSAIPGGGKWTNSVDVSGNLNTYSPSFGATPVISQALNGTVTFAGQVNGGAFMASGTGFSGNGLGLTNVPLPGNVVTNLILRPNGTNDSSAIIQAAFSTPYSVITFTPGNYYATNLWLTSNVTVYGNGAKIYQLAAASQGFAATNTDWVDNTNWNALINFGTGNINQRIYGLILDGMKPDSYQAYNFPVWAAGGNSFYILGADGNHGATNNIGFLINLAAGGEVSGCVAQNFGAAGYFITSSSDQSSMTAPHVLLHDNFSATNFCGVYVQGWGGGHPTLYGNAEYSLLNGFVINNCADGVSDAASNSQLGDSTINYCYIGLDIIGGNGNSGPHTRYHDLNLNHNTMGIWLGFCDYVAFDNIYEAATTTNIFKNVKTLQVNNCVLQNAWIDGQGASTNNWAQFSGGELANINSISNNLDIRNAVIASQCSWQGCNLNDLDNATSSAFSFSWTNWLTDVFTNYGGGTYAGNGGSKVSALVGNPPYVQSYVLATNQTAFTTVPTNSAISLVLARGTWTIEARLFESSVSGYNNYFRSDITFTNNTFSSTVQDFISDWSATGSNINGNWAMNSGDYPNWRSGMANANQFTSPDFGIFKFEGMIVATNTWCATVRFWPFATGTNQLWAGSYLIATRIAL